MDSSKKFTNPSPELRANLFSRLFFYWIIPFFKYGIKHDLEVKDLYNTTNLDLSEQLTDKLERNWINVVNEAKKKNIKPSLETAIKRTFISSYAWIGIGLLVQCLILSVVMPVLLSKYIAYFSEFPKDPRKGWLLGFSVIAVTGFRCVLFHYSNLASQRIGMRVRVACCSLLYRKVLKLNTLSLQSTDIGNVVNLLSNDVNRFDSSAANLHYIWIMPILAVFAGYVMWEYVGYAMIAGLGTMTIQAVPLQGYLSKLQGKYRFKIALKTDSRVKIMHEITSGIQVIKMYAWEKPFEKMVELLRKKEVDVISKTSYIKSVSIALMVFTERLTLYITVVAYVLLGNSITSSVVFSMAQILNTVQLYLCILFPMALSSYSEAKTSVYRLEEFLLKEEKEEEKTLLNISTRPGLIQLDYVNASWIPDPIVSTLIDLTFELKPGTLCCIVGNVGSGKSSILQLLLKELPLASGKLLIEGTISYASQEPWLFANTVRKNILFGQPYIKKKYNTVVEVCALERDFELFPLGDKTNVGEKGTSLSGGQRARINLARAVYKEADIYLLDDPLSAVDPHVSKHLFHKCIKEHLNGKTRILVTHQTQFLNQADVVIVLNNGKIETIGKPTELTSTQLKLLRQVSVPENTKVEEKTENEESEPRGRLKSISSIKTTNTEEDEEPQETQELIERGEMPFSIYKEYYLAGGNICILLFLGCLLILAQGFCNGGDLWLTYWTNNNEKIIYINDTTTTFMSPTISSSTFSTEMPTSSVSETTSENILLNTPELAAMPLIQNLQNASTEAPDLIDTVHMAFMADNITRDTYILVYTLFIIFSVILTTARSVLFYKICMNASKNLHNLMFNNILQATMRFFDTNPSGRILNRFSKDMGAVDELLPMSTLQAMQIFLVAAGILTMVFIKSAIMIIPTFILGIILIWLRKVFLKCAQDVKRLEGTTRAPVFSYVAASLDGLSTIRSAKAQTIVKKEFDNLQDVHTSAFYLFITCYEAFGFYLDFVSLFFLISVTLQFLLLDNVLGGDVGLVISQSLIIIGMLQFGIRQTADVASNMTSVERVLQYTKLDKEGPFQSLPINKPALDWPQSGKIIFKNVYLKYIIDEEPVLKNLNIEILPGEKIGIVGRTGAGKSTLISALFRLAHIDGTITIDNIDTSKMGLTDLRSKISIIPQEPILFSASIRYNLDPFSKADDATLWKAIENVELKDSIESLDSKVSEGGGNFSAGQRQLVCLARAIVRNNKILVMDEATANVDQNTDALIQKAIRKSFKDCTVLTVAHRLNTIMDSDRVIVMDAGQMVEFASPHELLQNSASFFSKMVVETGPKMEKTLRKVAEETYLAKKK